MDNFLDHYCERVSSQLWDEPLNFLTNVTFLIVAFLLIRKLLEIPQTRSKKSWDLWLLTGLIITIGAGSGIWHLLATGWALWADRIPILLFISLFLFSCLVRIFNLPILSAIILLVFFHIINTVIQYQFSPAVLNGSLFYVPTLLFLIGMTILLWNSHKSHRKYFLTASTLFFVAIIFRSIDLATCDIIPTGTHFVWHILIATTIYPLMAALLQISVSSSSRE